MPFRFRLHANDDVAHHQGQTVFRFRHAQFQTAQLHLKLYTNRCSSQNWTGSRQYGQIFILAVQRSHAS